ncbi:MAG: hypothetical protein AB8H79_01715 [Myxococcota bacterium]
MRCGWMLALGSMAVLSGCGTEAPWEFSGCDALDAGLCATPFPSTTQLVPDESRETGWRVNFQSSGMPTDREDQVLDTSAWNERDGFSVATPMLASLGDVDVSALPGHASIERYNDDVGSVLIDTVTGQRVPHWVEMDLHITNPDDRLLIMWPAQQLEFNRRYIVAYRGLTRPDGAVVPPTEAFVALRDGNKTDDPDLENRRRHYDTNVFPILEEAGFAQDELLLAWDFHTQSEASTRGRMTAMRDDALQRVADGPTYAWSKIEERDCDEPGVRIWKTLEGKFEVPLYTEKSGPNTRLNRGEDGMPFADGVAEPAFIVQVPCSVKAAPGPAHVVQYGHGLLGDYREAQSGWLRAFLDDQAFVLVATTQAGMSSEDYAAIGVMLARDLSGFPIVPERLHQGIIDNLVLTKLALGPLVSDPELAVGDVALLDGDATKIAWYGISQGGIVGGAIVGASPDIERAVFGVGGGPYPMMLPRSVDFEPFFEIVKGRYPNEQEQMFLMQGMLVQLWDSTESAAWGDALKNKRVLSQIALADAQVHREASRWQARSMGATLVTPETEPVWGLNASSSPVQGNAYVEVDFGYDQGTDVNLPPDDATDTHECQRRVPELQEQVARFIRSGEIVHTCDGPCRFTPETCP